MAVSVLPFPGAGLDPLAEPRPAPSRAPRWLVVHLPAFRLERCGVSPDELAGLLDEERNALRVVALTPAAHAEGLRRGATAAEARAQLPEIVLLRLDREGESRDRAELLRAFSGLSDAIATLGEDDLRCLAPRTCSEGRRVWSQRPRRKRIAWVIAPMSPSRMTLGRPRPSRGGPSRRAGSPPRSSRWALGAPGSRGCR